jgi:hypothetical protein
MHAHDRTLLAKLGFADPDKANPLHDLACQYLAAPDISLAVVDAVFPEWRDEVGHFERNGVRYNRSIDREVPAATVEKMISKGEGQYMTTIGFIDVILDITFRKRVVGYRDVIRRCHGHSWTLKEMVASLGGPICSTLPKTTLVRGSGPGPELYHLDYTEHDDEWFQERLVEQDQLAVEVKIMPVSAGEIIRQINLYRGYYPVDNWAVVADFDIGRSGEDMLASEGISYLRLSDRFGAWVAEQERINAESPSESVALI